MTGSQRHWPAAVLCMALLTGASSGAEASMVSCAVPETALPLRWSVIEASVVGNSSAAYLVPGTMVQFRCRDAGEAAYDAVYDLDGKEKLTCLRTGAWSDPQPTCRMHHQQLTTVSAEDVRGDSLTKDAMTIIVIVGAVVTFLVFATFVFVVVARRWYPSDCNRRRRLLQTTAEDACPSDYHDSDRDLLVAAAAAAHLHCAPYVAPPPSYEESMTDVQRGRLYASYTDDDCTSDLRFVNAFRAYRPLVGAVMEPALVSTMSSLVDSGLDTRSLGAQSAVASGAYCANRCHGHGHRGAYAGTVPGGNDTVSEILPCDATSASDASTFVTLSTYDGTNSSSRTSGLVCSLASAAAAADAQSDCPGAGDRTS